MKIKLFFLVFCLLPCLKGQSQIYVNVCVNQPAPLQADAGASNTACSDSIVIGGDPTASSGTPAYTYSWSPIAGLSSSSASNPKALPSDTTTYTLTVTDLYGCSAISTVSVFAPPFQQVYAGNDDTLEIGESTQLAASGTENYIWNPATGLSCTNCPDPIANPLSTTTYYVTGMYGLYCSSYDTVTVFVTPKPETLYLSTSFSPNDDDVNDVFYVYGYSIKTITMDIYDKWGEQVFHTNDITEGWDGKLNGNYVEGGVYVYSVKCQWESEKKIYKKGIVTLVK